MSRGSKHKPSARRPDPGASASFSPDHPLEKENAVEWGERLQTGKMIARGGKSTGFVAGATEQLTIAQTRTKGTP